MWVWKPQNTDGGNAAAIVARARAVGLTHLFVRTGSSWDDFDGGPFLDKLLPAAHAAGIKVYGWDFPNFVDWQRDVGRAGTAIIYRTPGGHSIDGFAADIETPSEGTRMTPPVALAYGAELRRNVGPGVLLIAVVPRPSPQVLQVYPYDNVVAAFDVIAPMVYWLNREPIEDTTVAMLALARLGKPLMPVGQAYDGGPEGGRPGVPPRTELLQFMYIAHRYGAIGVSFWSWQHANAEAWDAIRDGPTFLHVPIPPTGRR
jgi:hypothetical protein